VLKVSQQSVGQELVMELAGAIDEQAEFINPIYLPASKCIRVRCQGVTRVNSVGVKVWIKYFGHLAGLGTPLIFELMPPVLVEQINSIKNFTCGGKVGSILLPFKCPKCQASFNWGIETGKIRIMLQDVPNQPCPKCQTPAVFDDLPEEYFEFFARGDS
jgi:endogenous inhibitor of DNA gyrase (YacG/DUF329 family)